MHSRNFGVPEIYSRALSSSFPSIHVRHSSFSNPSIALSTSQLILQPFRCLTYLIAHSLTLLSLLSVASLTSQVIFQPFLRFTNVTAHSPNLPSLYLRMSELILQTFRCFTYVIAHSPTLLSLLSVSSPASQFIFQPFPSLYQCHSSFSKPPVALPMSKLILQTFRCFIYVTAHSPTLLSLLLHHRIFTHVTWRAAHAAFPEKFQWNSFPN